MVCIECRFVEVSICVLFAGAPFPFEIFAVAFCGSQAFCVSAGLLGGSSLFGCLEWYYCVGVVHDPGVEVSYAQVRVAG